MKKSSLIWIVLVVSTLSASAGHAVPLTYNLKFDALLGPSGIGSFQYDTDAKLLTNLSWDFGDGIVGGFSFFPTPPIFNGSTSSSFLAELLGQSDFDPNFNCIVGSALSCRSTRFGAIGTTPGNVNSVTFSVAMSSGPFVFYSFASATTGPFVPGETPPSPVFGPSTANGHVLAALAVPEPSSFPLLMLGVAVIWSVRRRTLVA